MTTTTQTQTKPRFHRVVRGQYTVLTQNGREVTAIYGPATLDELIAQWEEELRRREEEER